VKDRGTTRLGGQKGGSQKTGERSGKGRGKAFSRRGRSSFPPPPRKTKPPGGEGSKVRRGGHAHFQEREAFGKKTGTLRGKEGMDREWIRGRWRKCRGPFLRIIKRTPRRKSVVSQREAGICLPVGSLTRKIKESLARKKGENWGESHKGETRSRVVHRSLLELVTLTCEKKVPKTSNWLKKIERPWLKKKRSFKGQEGYYPLSGLFVAARKRRRSKRKSSRKELQGI